MTPVFLVVIVTRNRYSKKPGSAHNSDSFESVNNSTNSSETISGITIDTLAEVLKGTEPTIVNSDTVDTVI